MKVSILFLLAITVVAPSCSDSPVSGVPVCGGAACQDHASCQPDTGECACDDGFHPEGDACIAEGEDACAEAICQDNATCSVASGQCECDDGYHLEAASCVADVAGLCDDVTCQDNATCDGGSGQCECDDGYHLEAASCVADVADLCDGVTCQNNATCDAASGQCECDDGYHLEAASCVADVADLCDGVTCQDNATCDAGTGDCTCDDGFTAEGNSCVEPCEDEITAAHQNDDFGSAFELAVPSSYADLNLSSDSGSACEYADDWYAISYIYGYTFRVVVSGHAGNVALTLFDTSLNELGQSTSSGGSEELEFTLDDNQSVYVRVASSASAEVRYDITASKSCGSGMVENLLLGRCIPSYCAVRSQVYLHCDQDTSWYDSRDICSSLGAHLVTVDSQSESDLLATYASELHLYWNGYNKLDRTDWQWLYGTSSFENWWSGQPADGTMGLLYDCARMDAPSFEWGAADCYTRNYFICELDD